MGNTQHSNSYFEGKADFERGKKLFNESVNQAPQLPKPAMFQ